MLKPIARLFISQRIPFNVLAEVAKRAFVEEAYEHFAPETRSQTKSRACLITGLSRNDIHRHLVNPVALPNFLGVHRSRAADLVEAWHTDATFQNENGTPRPLPIRGDGVTFTALVRRYTADVPVSTMLEELVCTAMVEFDDYQRVLPRKPHYAPKPGLAPELIQAMGRAGHWLNSTAAHNILTESTGSDDRLFQRHRFSDTLPPERVAECRKELRALLSRYYDECTNYLDAVEDQHRIDGYHATVGVGLYYFEE